ncbi:MAG: type IV toxin-antitoxin system AbiEi family antitoxin domain-containing protein [Candidatus Marinimicrobia bacterium]|nr:type IV toxin-antitoxin system AbiEi family antitoxin domain-containing protein [Candidatus Neomarinimicrobiota bacterium]
MKLLQSLRKTGKLYFNIQDLRKISAYSTDSLYVILNRLVKRNELIRLCPGIYILPEKIGAIEIIANLIYYPSYLSFDSALARYGLISQIPYTFSFATLRKPKSLTLLDYDIEYSMINKSYFSGYVKLKNGLFIASPEKALVDMIYIASFGKTYFDFGDIVLTKIDLKKFNRILSRYPLSVKNKAAKLIRFE